MLPVRIIEPRSGLHAFRKGVESLVSGFSEARHIAWRFFLRDTRAAHRSSFVGYSWLIIAPLVNTLVWVFLNGQDIIRIDTGSVPYPVFVLAGTILWGAFTGALTAMMGVVSGAAGTLSKVNFAHEAMIYCGLLKVLVDACIPMVLLVPALFIYHVAWSPGMLLYPVAMLSSIACGAGLGLLLSPITALLSDLSRLIHLGLRFAFFVTPVVFALPAAGLGRAVMLCNPLTPVLVSGRAWLAGSADAMPAAFILVSAISLGLLAVGLVLFKVTLPSLIERIGG
jgi:lipopolysaccharide transport system permease protein